MVSLTAQAQTTSKPNVYVQHNLVSDIAGMADVTDPNLVDPWGVSTSATSPFWISDAGTSKSTLYNGAGTITALVVSIPDGAKGPAKSSPSGQVACHEEAVRLAGALAELPEAQREALVLQHWHGLTLAQIGERLGRTPVAVAGLLKRGLKALRQRLGDPA